MSQSEAGKRSRASREFEVDEDIDDGCESVMSKPVSRGGASKRSRYSAGSKKSKVQPSEGLAAPDEEEENLMCGLCEEPITEADDCDHKTLSGFMFHPRCKNAVRCRRRQLTQKDRKEFDANMVDKPWIFRGECLPLVLKPGQSVRDINVRNKIKSKTARDKHTIKDNVSQKLLLTRPRFYRYHKQWDGWNRDKSNAVFDSKLSQQLGVQYYFMLYSIWKFVYFTIDISLSLLHVFQKSTCVCRKFQKCR